MLSLALPGQQDTARLRRASGLRLRRDGLRHAACLAVARLALPALALALALGDAQEGGEGHQTGAQAHQGVGGEHGLLAGEGLPGGQGLWPRQGASEGQNGAGTRGRGEVASSLSSRVSLRLLMGLDP